MEKFLATLVECSITMSVISLVFMAITPLLVRRYEAKWRYYTWLIVVVGLIIPFRPQMDTGFIQVQLLNSISSSVVTTQQPYTNYIQSDDTGAEMTINTIAVPVPDVPSKFAPNADTTPIPNIQWGQIVSYLWIIGMVVFLLIHIFRQKRFTSMVHRWSEEIEEPRILYIFQEIKDELRGTKRVTIKLCSCIKSPMMIGFIKPVILLPTTDFSSDELKFILKHECIHYLRKDLWYKAIVLIATSMHWFNPIVYFMNRAVSAACEESCDEAVVRNVDLKDRQVYGETIIGLAKQQMQNQTQLVTHFYSDKKGLKNRIVTIMDTGRKRAGMAVFCCVLLGTFATGSVFAHEEVQVTDLTQISGYSTISGSSDDPEVEVIEDTDGNTITFTQSYISSEPGNLVTKDIGAPFPKDTIPFSAGCASDNNDYFVKALLKNAVLGELSEDQIYASEQKASKIILEILKSKVYNNPEVLTSDVENALAKEFPNVKEYLVVHVSKLMNPALGGSNEK
ncbi:beta-lactamase regulating signal transducer with metallopeptidase domain [Paenibacillus anaericanus]|uniref:M56 family metallopeptidase n=1 Tax=Paenibacillus anaericanus TaxID=170367 RepID=UPI002789FC75|nr:M56 family metallopeptidase [Paenibacillus anaericanus]MDQ0091999.1 beta-lactamase regulating signal transducer with metallopeptidase domain [Paenibacillus anaericanus]